MMLLSPVEASLSSRETQLSLLSTVPTHRIVLLDILVNRLLDEGDCFLSSAPACRSRRTHPDRVRNRPHAEIGVRAELTSKKLELLMVNGG